LFAMGSDPREWKGGVKEGDAEVCGPGTILRTRIRSNS
jgi:hypothetical protein